MTYEQLIDHTEAVLCELEPQTFTTLFINSYVERLLGYPTVTWLKTPAFWLDHIHPDDRPWVVEYTRQTMLAGNPFTLEYRMIAKNGRSIWLRDTMRVEMENGRPHRLYSIKIDISAHKQIEALLHHHNSLQHPNQTTSYEDRLARERAEVLREFAHIVASSLDSEDVLKRSLHQLQRVLVFDSASIYLNPRDLEPEFVAGIGYEDVEMTNRAAIDALRYSPILFKMSQDLKPVLSPDVNYLEGWIWVAGAEYVRSFMAAPLIGREGSMMGALMVDSKQVGFFRESDLQMVEALASHLSTSIENAWLFSKAQKQLAEKTALLAASTAVSSTLDLAIVLTRLAEQMVKAIGVTSAYISDWNPETLLSTELAEYYAPEASPLERVSDLGATYHNANDFGLLEATIRNINGFTFQVDDPTVDPRKREHMQRYGAKSCLLIPLVIKDSVIGFAELWESRYPRQFTVSEIELCKGIARQAAVAIENARLYAQASRRANELMILHEVALVTAVIVDIDQLLQQTTRMIVATLYPDVFGFVMFDPTQNSLKPHFSFHGIPNTFYLQDIPLHTSVVGKVALTGKPHIVRDVTQEPLYFLGTSSSRSEIAVPLKVGTDVIAVINVESPTPGIFSDQDVNFLMTLAAQVAVAIERTHLYKELRLQADNLSQLVASRTAELRVERDRTLAILESAGEGIILTNPNAQILYVNPAMERISGYSRSELVQQNPRVFGSNQTSKSLFQEMWHTLSTGQRWRGELINRRKDGTLYDVSLTVNPILDKNGQVTGYVGVQSDISRLKEVERLKTKFVSNVSHELRTPLTNIKTYLTLLERGKDEKRQHYLKVVHHETDRLAGIIQDLLTISRLDAEPGVEVITPSDPLFAINEIFDVFAAKAESRQIAFTCEIPYPLPMVRMESRHLEQLLINLVGNAFAYTPKDGAVQILADVALNEGMVWIRVVDNGVGIPPDDIPRLFERFFRGQVAEEIGVSGTGLGLAICKEILDRYGGKIEVQSKLGYGSEFTVWLPMETAVI